MPTYTLNLGGVTINTHYQHPDQLRHILMSTYVNGEPYLAEDEPTPSPDTPPRRHMALSDRAVNVQREYRPAAGQKRKTTDDPDVNVPKKLQPDALYKPRISEAEAAQMETWAPYKDWAHSYPNCDHVRRAIRHYLDAGAKVGEFCKEIGVSNRSLNAFLRQNGPHKGDESNTYRYAHSFFTHRELRRQRMVEEKKSKRPATDTTTPASGTETRTNTGVQASTSNSNSKSTKTAEKPKSVDISGIHLEDEDYDNVPVHDSCDEIRRKIDAHLKKPNVTQAQFMRDIHAQLRSADAPAKIQSNMLTAFRSKKGAVAGNTSSVYYAAYVYFEKVRLAENGKKTKHREDMERVWPRGVDRDRPVDRVFCAAGSQPSMDKYGRLSFS